MIKLGTQHLLHVADIIERPGKSRVFRTVVIDRCDGAQCARIPCDIGSDAAPAKGDTIEAYFALDGRDWQGRDFAVVRLVDWAVAVAAEPSEASEGLLDASQRAATRAVDVPQGKAAGAIPEKSADEALPF